MENLEQLLYDLGDILRGRHKLYISRIFEAKVEDFLEKDMVLFLKYLTGAI